MRTHCVTLNKTRYTEASPSKHITSHGPQLESQLSPLPHQTNSIPTSCYHQELPLQYPRPVLLFNKTETVKLAMSGAQQMGLRKRTPPFPLRQMTILGEFESHKAPSCRCEFASQRELKLTPVFKTTALCRICEPIAFMSIFPYVYYMIKDFEVAKNESEIAVYAGTVTSAFAFAEFLSGVVWGRLSDKIGRKPVLLTGLAGTALSMVIFGFAPNLKIALLARALGGLLNG